MKQFWCGVVILAVLFGAGLCLGGILEDIHSQSAADLEKAANSAMEGDWPLASALTARAKKQWSKYRNPTAAFLSHGPLEQIDMGFDQMELFAARENALQYASVCRKLSQLLESIHQNHRFSWSNLL